MKPFKYMIPLLGMILLLFYFESILKNSREKFETRLMTEEVHWVNDMTAKLNEEESIYHSESVRQLSRDYIISMIENADREKGIFACVLDSSFKLVSKRFSDDDVSVDTIRISESEKWNISIQKNGYIHIKIRGKMMNTFFISYPSNEAEYYILIGVSPYVFDEIFNIRKITIVFFIILIISFAGVYLSIFEINNQRK